MLAVAIHYGSGIHNHQEGKIALQSVLTRVVEAEERAETLLAAMEYAVIHHDIYWIEDWIDGDPEAMAELDKWRKDNT